MRSEQRRSDHDILITLETKVDRLTLDIKEMGDGIAERIAKLELKSETRDAQLNERVNALEKLRDEVNPLPLVKRVENHDQFIRDFKLIWRVMIIISTGTGSILGFLIHLLLNYWR